jgi:ParB family chromosome partitioning protein
VSAPKPGLPPKRRMRHDRHFVDELTQRMGEGIGRMVRVTTISSNHDQPRSSLGELDDLVSSITRHGILEPLLVRRLDGGKYELVSGERRFHAAMEAGLAEVPCIELSVNDEQALEIALIENLQRKDLSPFEEGEGFRTLIEKYGYTHQQVAEAVGRSRVTVTEALKILEIPQEIRDLCRHADITAKGVLLEIAKAPSVDTMYQLIEQIVEERLDRAEVRIRRQELSEANEAAADSGRPAAEEARPLDGTPPVTKRRPFLFRFRHPEKPFSLSLSFRSEREPEPQEIISALEEMIDRLRAEMSQQK